MLNLNHLECRRIAAIIVEQLINSAQEDNRGVYWVNRQRTADAGANALADVSLSNGTSGVLLFLAEYYRQTQDQQIVAPIEKGLAWLKSRALDAPLSHGFYRGHAGYLYARSEILRCLGRVVTQQETSETTELMTKLLAKKNAPFSDVSWGTAGTLLALAAMRQPSQASSDSLGWEIQLLRGLARQARLTNRGIYWDRYPNSSRPCIGYMTGNAGIEYVLAHYQTSQAMDGIRWLGAAAAAYDDGEFDESLKNWRDYHHEKHFTAPRVREELRDAAIRGESAKFVAFGDAANWCNGAAGVLLARLALLEKTGAESEKRDVERAVQRACVEVGRMNPANSLFTLRTGLGGIALSLASASRSSAQAVQAISQIVESCLTQHAKLGLFRTDADENSIDHGLLNGAAGIGYFLLRIASDDFMGPSILGPISGQQPIAEPILSQKDCLGEMVKGQLPLTARVCDGNFTLEPPVTLTLDNVLASGAKAVPNNLTRAVFEYEAEKLRNEQLQEPYNFLWQSSQIRRQKYDKEWAYVTDDQLARESVMLAPNIQLGKVSFLLDPQKRDIAPIEGASFVLLAPAFDRIREYILPAGQYAMYSHIKGPVRINTLSSLLTKKYPSLVKAAGGNLTPFVLQQIRSGLRDGFLVTVRQSVSRRTADWIMDLGKWRQK